MTSCTNSSSSSDSSLSEDNYRPVTEGSGTQAIRDRLVNLICVIKLISAACPCSIVEGKSRFLILLVGDLPPSSPSHAVMKSVWKSPACHLCRNRDIFKVYSSLCAGSPCSRIWGMSKIVLAWALFVSYQKRSEKMSLSSKIREGLVLSCI